MASFARCAVAAELVAQVLELLVFSRPDPHQPSHVIDP
jgi:hypothetical protein